MRLDDVASAERSAFKTQNPGVKLPPWLQFFREACERIQRLIRDQLEQVFQQSISSAISETRSQRADAVEGVISQLQIHPVSAIEFRKVHADDSEDAAKIKDAADSNIPALVDSLQELARQHRNILTSEYTDILHRLCDSIARGLERIHDEVSSDERKLARVATLRDSLDKTIKPGADEFLNRKGALRERLKGTIPQTIATEVERAIAAAERGVREYFKGLHKLHWATLRGTIRRGGTWIRSRPVDLPNELALRFEEPLAVAWNQAVVGPLGKTLTEFSTDVKRLLEKVGAWAGTAGGLDVAHVKSFQADVEAEVSLLASRGQKAAAELTARAKQQLHSVIQEEIRTACQRFVDERLDVGGGVKNRVIAFLERLAPQVAAVAKSTASRFLRESYDAVLIEVSGGFKRFDDPVARVKSLLLGDQTTAGDAQQRTIEGRQVKTLLGDLESIRKEIAA